MSVLPAASFSAESAATQFDVPSSFDSLPARAGGDAPPLLPAELRPLMRLPLVMERACADANPDAAAAWRVKVLQDLNVQLSHL
jgi:hypothetical protein